MKRQLIARFLWVRIISAATVVAAMAGVAPAQILFSENFNGLTLGPSVNERVGQARVTLRPAAFGASVPWMGPAGNVPNSPAFSHTGPAGWTINNTTYDAYGASVDAPGTPLIGDPNYGVDEWEGWSFANKSFWIFADDQGRSNFTNGAGTVAVADADEWDDLTLDATGASIPRQGFMDTELTTGNINVAAYQGQNLTLKFDSSWDAEAFDDTHVNPVFNNLNNQSVVIAASFDGAPPASDVFLTFWDSNSAGGFYKPTAYNETIMANLAVPALATNVKLKFGYYSAANDWWWAIDNLELKDSGSNNVWTENFETVALGPSVNERVAISKVTAANNDAATQPRPGSFTNTPPAGWSINNSGIDPIAIGNNNRGVYEWEGWNFADTAFWSFASQTDANSFTKASGPYAIADSDEFADLGGTNPADPAGTGDVTTPMSTVLQSPSINITGITAGSMMLAFDSCWRPEGTAQSAEITVDYGSGPLVVLRWDSDPASPNQHGTDAAGAPNLNESVLIPLNNPAGATAATIKFAYLNGSNNWFWAVDNIVVTGVPEPCIATLSCFAIMGLSLLRRRRS